MTIDELIKALGLDEANAAVLRKFVATQEKTITDKAADIKVLKAQTKGDAGKIKTLQERVEKFQDALGIDADVEDIEESIKSVMKEKTADPALQKQITNLKEKLRVKDEEHNSTLSEERGKRFDGMKRTALLEALGKNNADDPNLLVDMLIGKIVVNEDDESLAFNDDKNSKIDDYVKEFLTAHPKLIANIQKPGAGSLLGANGGASNDNESTEYAKKLAESGNSNSTENAKALEGYFK